MNENNFVSGGRNPNWELTCNSPRCCYFHETTDFNCSGGWCKHPKNKRKSQDMVHVWFEPSVTINGGCDLHSCNERKTPNE